MRKKILTLFINVPVIFISISCIFPIIWMLYNSVKSESEFAMNKLALPSKINFENYVEAIRIGKMQNYFVNSIYNAVITVIIVVLLSFFIAYFISRFEFKGKRIIYYLFLFGMLVPIHSLLIPIFIEFSRLDLLNKPYTLLFPYVAFGMPLAIFLLDSFIKTIPIEVEEAAIIDGCGTFARIMKIVFPLCKPVIATVVVLSFLGAWNEFPFALTLLTSNDYKTIPIGLANFSGQYSTSYTPLMAGLVIATLPVIIIYIIFNKQIVKGMTAGAVKG